MRRWNVLSALAIVVLVTMVLTPGHADSKRYTAGTVGDVQVICDYDTPAATSVGGVCFKNVTSSTVTLTARDDVVAQTGFWVGFYKSNGDCAGVDDPIFGCSTFYGPFCNKATLARPSGGSQVVAFLDGAFNELDCEELPTTNGTVTLS